MRQSEQQLRDEIVLREASLADARRELAAGELTTIQAATIEAREELALARVRQELSELTESTPTRPSRRRRRRRSLLVIGLLCFLAVIIIVLWSSIELRQAGTQITGNVSLSNSQQVTQLLTEAQADVADGNVSAALAAYDSVLGLNPKNVPALTETGWLDFSAGSSDTNPSLVAIGVKDLREAIAYGPRNTAARLYYAIIADSTPGNEALAKNEFRVFLALHPSKGQLAIARQFLIALKLPTS
jgi:cytochrome c-type biogenesis protein CcmH/NrfG